MLLCNALTFHATWLPSFNLLFMFHPLSNITFHVARFLSDSLFASNTRYNGLHFFLVEATDTPITLVRRGAIQRLAWGHPAPRCLMVMRRLTPDHPASAPRHQWESVSVF